MTDAARTAHPYEACGLMLGDGAQITDIRPAKNVHPTPLTHFEIDPQTLIDAHRAERGRGEKRDGGLALMGYYHSHPTGDPSPSATDQALAAGDDRIWAIIGDDEVRFWQSTDQGFTPLPIKVIEG